jgi:hypothetical protein|tara:strand:- start:241 stop:378 length:138 start_codon:yes stop_codon:yes gene_type:complete
MFLVALGLILAKAPMLVPTIGNLVSIIIGNIIIAATYWFRYLKDR